MKPRFTIFLEAHGHTEETYRAAQDEADLRGDFASLTIDGVPQLIYGVYARWSNAEAAEWTKQLGYGDEYRSFDLAMADGHSFLEFDEWLNKKYGGV